MGIRVDTEEFVKRALKVHEGRYDYSRAECDGWNSIVEIICKDHGVFKQSAKSHCRGNGCKKCSSRKKTAKKFIDKAKVIHGSTYDYSKVRYKNSTLPVDIICKVHGIFSQRASTHTAGFGCPRCTGRNKSTDDYIQQARTVHSEIYSYEKVAYLDARTEVVITCKVHGDFSQNANSHLQGAGCPKCSKSGFDLTKDSWFYVLKCVSGSSEEGFCGYGISADYKRRMTEHQLTLNAGGYSVSEFYVVKNSGEDTLEIERTVKKLFELTPTNFKGFKREATYLDNYSHIITYLNSRGNLETIDSSKNSIKS